jgi:hypothetical protein
MVPGLAVWILPRARRLPPWVLIGPPVLATTFSAPSFARSATMGSPADRSCVPGDALMPRADDIPSASVGLAAGLSLIALFLALREWFERKAREQYLSPADELYFWHQDVRRRLGVGVLIAIAALALAGSRIEPRAAGRANLVFVVLWLTVLTLIVVLLGLALADLLATRSYARRRRREMLRESIEAIRQQARQASARARNEENGSHDAPPSGRPD